MTGRRMIIALSSSAAVFGHVQPAMGVDKLVTANANLSTLVTVDDTVLRWTGNYTVTVDSAVDKTVAGIDAGSFTATIDFQNADRKILLGNTAGNVVVQASGGDVRIQGAGAGVRTAGFLVSPSLTGETVEVRTPIDDAVNANYWIIGNNTLLLAGTSPQIGALDIGVDSGVAKLDVDQGATVDLITSQGDFTIDVAAGKTLAITQAFAAGANTLTVIGGGSSASITHGAQMTLDNASSVLRISGTIIIDDLDLGASAGITLLDGAALTLTDAVSIGARTLTLTGTTGSAAETITAAGGFVLDNANSLLKIAGDSANAMVVSTVTTAADMNAGKGLDADQSVQFTALTVTNNMTLDIASGKTVSGTVALNAAKTVVLNNTGTLSALTAATAAGTVQFTGAGTITTLTNDITGLTIDVDESAAIGALTSNQSSTIDVATGKTLTATATVPAGKVLSHTGAGTISNVVLNGAAAELFMTGGGIVTTLDVNADSSVLDVDTNNVTITTCNMKAASGDLTVENANRTITSTGGFNVRDNTLKITQATGAISLVNLDSDGGILDVDESTTITDLEVLASAKVQVATGKTLSTTATVASTGELNAADVGVITAVTLDGSGAEFSTSAIGAVNALTVAADGGLVNIDNTFSLTAVTMAAGAGDLTVDVANGVTLVAAIDVNDNTLTLSNTGIPGTITLDTAGGVLEVDADSTPNGVNVNADVTIDVASGKTLNTVIDIASRTLTLSGAGTIARINAGAATINATGSTTLTDLRANFGSGGTFNYNGTGDSTITTLNNSTVAGGETFAKSGGGTLTVLSGLTSFLAQATGVHVRVDGGELIVGSSSANNDITFNDDSDDVFVAAGATLTTYGSLTVSQAGTHVNLNAEPGSAVNLLSSSAGRLITAAADNDFQLLGSVNIGGAGGGYALEGDHVFQFGDLDISGTASLTNDVPSSSIEFAPDSEVSLKGSGVDGGGLFIDGGATDTRITLTTTTRSGTFTIDKGQSGNLQIDFVALGNSTYRSDGAKSAVEEVNLTGTADVGNNVNWFSREAVDDGEDDGSQTDDTTDDTGTVDDGMDDDTLPGDLVTYVGPASSISATGTAAASARSDATGASAQVEIKEAESGTLFVTLADGNLRTDFAGITDQQALPVTMRVTSSVTGEFSAIVQLCYTADMLTASSLEASQLVMYTFDETAVQWVLAGQSGHYRGDMAPTFIVGDYGYESQSNCAWVVTNHFSDFAVGVGATYSSQVGDDTTDDDASGDGSTPTMTGNRPPVCGMLTTATMVLMAAGFACLKLICPVRRPSLRETRGI